MNPLNTAHTHVSGGDLETILPVTALVVLAAGYLFLALRRSREPKGWSIWRTVSFLAGIGLLIPAMVPQLLPLPAGSFAAHMSQHLLVGMYAPLGMVLGAPVTLVLRSVPSRQGKTIGCLLRSTPMAILAHPLSALVLSLGGLYLL